MAIKTRQELKVFFEATKRPTQDEFYDLIESFVHLNEDDFVNSNEMSQAIQDLSNQVPSMAPIQSVNGMQGDVEILIPTPPVLTVNGLQGNVTLPVVEDGGWSILDSGQFSNSTSSYDINTTIRYRKVNSVIYLDGCLKGGTSQTNGLSYLLFTLPSGFRPGRKCSFAIVRANTATTFITGRIDIDVNGSVYGVNYSNIWTNLSGISFFID